MELTGLAAQTWDDFVGDGPQLDYDAFRHLIESNPGLALDAGCGTGRLLIPYLASGIAIEGVDSSSEALAICRGKAAGMGLAPVLYHQAMQHLELPKHYSTIIMPGGSFHLLRERDAANEALWRLHSHLEAGGVLAMSLYDPVDELSDDAPKGWRPYKSAIRMQDGAGLQQHMMTADIDHTEQLKTTEIRYRVIRSGRVVQEEIHTMKMRLYYWSEIRGMLDEAGFGEVRAHGLGPAAEGVEPEWRPLVVAKKRALPGKDAT